jgi:hypothetical protein
LNTPDALIPHVARLTAIILQRVVGFSARAYLLSELNTHCEVLSKITENHIGLVPDRMVMPMKSRGHRDTGVSKKEIKEIFLRYFDLRGYGCD